MHTETRKPDAALTADLSAVVDRQGEWHIVVLTGKFVVRNIALVRQVCDSILSQKALRIALDLTGITQIDSSALTVMLNIQKQLRQTGGTMALIGPNEPIKETLLMVRFDLAVPLYSDRAAFERSSAVQ